MDVIALAYILKRPIHVYQKLIRKGDDSENRLYKNDIYDDDTIRSNHPISILFNGENHFEALVPQSPIYISSTSPSPKSKTPPSARLAVLVLCQRKEGTCDDSSGLLVQKSIVPMIEKYVSQYLKKKAHTIEYLTQRESAAPGDKVDFNMKIASDSKEFQEFASQHWKHYSVIILNTCPFMMMKYGLISDLLMDNGVLILSKVNCRDITNKGLFNIRPSDVTGNGGDLTTFFEYKKKGGIYRKVAKGTKRKRETQKKKPAAEVTRTKKGHYTRGKADKDTFIHNRYIP